MTNILYYEPSSGFGGSSNALANLVNSLDRSRFTPFVAVKNYGSQLTNITNAKMFKLKNYTEEKHCSKFQFIYLLLFNIFPEIVHLLIVLIINKIDIVHINTNIISGIPAIIAAKLSNKNCIVHIRQTRTPIKRELVFLRNIKKIIFINNFASSLFPKQFNNKYKIIHDGISLETFTHNTCREKENKSIAVGLIGRIVEGKGHENFILAAKRIIDNGFDVSFKIIGEAKGESDEYYLRIKKLLENLNLENKIILAGWSSNIIEQYNNLDILVQPATFPEGFGLTIVEAMALKKPVIATNIGGPLDIIEDNITGFLIDPNNVEALSEKITFLIENPDIARKMGEEGRKRVEEHFDIKDTVKRIEEVYEEVLEKR